MYPLIYKYLLLNKQVSIPGVGNFEIQRTSAKLDFLHNTIKAPQEEVVFKNETALADKNFFKFLALEMNVDEIDSIKQFHEYAHHLKSEINNSSVVELPQLGVIRKDNMGKLQFENVLSLKNYFVDTHVTHLDKKEVEKVVINESKTVIDSEEEDMYIEGTPKKDLWWVWAILLGLIGLAALYYIS